jgi:hypothetical protein
MYSRSVSSDKRALPPHITGYLKPSYSLDYGFSDERLPRLAGQAHERRDAEAHEAFLTPSRKLRAVI